MIKTTLKVILMLKILTFFILISLKLFAGTLHSTYYVNSNNIKLMDIFPDARYDVTLYKIDYNRYSKKISSKKLINRLKEHGFDTVYPSSRYIKFIKKSPINTSKIESDILNIYKNKYPNIKINSILVTPRGYVKELPKNYQLIMSKRSYLSNSGTFSIKTPQHKKIFFDYIIDAKLDIFTSKQTIKRGEKISLLNTSKKNVLFSRFKAPPISETDLDNIQMKKHIKQGSIITTRDIEILDIVKKGSSVIANLKNKSINISFSAKALRNGKLNDIITVQKSSGQKLKVKVIGINRVEIR